MTDTPDLSRIVNLIMQNPSLITEISNLARADAEEHGTEPAAESVEETAESMLEASAEPKTALRSHRHELLTAMKPYLSESRRSAIDSMESIAGILDMMRKK